MGRKAEGGEARGCVEVDQREEAKEIEDEEA